MCSCVGSKDDAKRRHRGGTGRSRAAVSGDKKLEAVSQADRRSRHCAGGGITDEGSTSAGGGRGRWLVTYRTYQGGCRGGKIQGGRMENGEWSMARLEEGSVECARWRLGEEKRKGKKRAEGRERPDRQRWRGRRRRSRRDCGLLWWWKSGRWRKEGEKRRRSRRTHQT